MTQKERRASCVSQHRVLIVDQWTPLGAFCTCLTCGYTGHFNRNILDEVYTGYEHTSQAGPAHDSCVFIYNLILENR